MPTEEQQLVIRSRDSEIPPTRVIDCRWLSDGFGDRRGKTVRLGMQIAFGRVRRKTAPTKTGESARLGNLASGEYDKRVRFKSDILFYLIYHSVF